MAALALRAPSRTHSPPDRPDDFHLAAGSKVQGVNEIPASRGVLESGGPVVGLVALQQNQPAPSFGRLATTLACLQFDQGSLTR